MARRQVIGGNWQDSLGNDLALGYVTFQINTDATSGIDQVNAGQIVTAQLDSSGNISGTFDLWENSSLLPSNTVYRIKAYSSKGQLAWESENVIPSGAGPFDLGLLIPLIY